MNKILIITGVFYPEPVVSARLLHSTYLTLKNKGNKVQVLCPFPSRPFGFKFNSSYSDNNIHRLNSYVAKKPNFIFKFIESISFGFHASRNLLNRSDVSIVYNAGWFLPSRVFIALVCRFKNIPYITPVQDIYPESIHLVVSDKNIFKNIFKNILLFLDKFLLKNAKKVHVISDGMLDYLSKSRNICKSKFELIYNWSDLDFSEHHEIVNKKYDFVYLGNMGLLSGVKELVSSFVNENSISICFGGGGLYKNLVIEKSKNNSNINFTEVLKGKEISFLKKGRYAVLPAASGVENFSIPSKAIAYLGSGLPIVSNLPSNNDLMKILKIYNCVIQLNSIQEIENFNFDNYNSLYFEMCENAERCHKEIFSLNINLNKLVNLLVNCEKIT